MSKMDDMRAMREARYRRAGATPPRDGQPATTRSAPVAPPESADGPAAQPAAQPAAKKSPARRRAAAAPATGAAAPGSTELCGHRAISGRTCTREQGHAAKSHRYA